MLHFTSRLVILFIFRYGDITPRSVPGKIIAMIWTLVGLVLTGILTGALTSTVTTLTIPVATSLYGSKVGNRITSLKEFAMNQLLPLQMH